MSAALEDRLKSLMLRAPKLTLAVAESMTSGRVQARIGRTSGASVYFHGGITAYTLEQKVRHLGVNEAAARAVDCVSAAVAEQMARGARALFGADVGVATTGYAEPQAGVAQPFAWWAVAGPGASGKIIARSGRTDCPGASRTQAQEQVAEAAITAVIAFLEELLLGR